MKHFTETKKLWCAVLLFAAARVPQAFANPTGLSVGSGSAVAQQIGAQLNVTVSQTAILNWQSFNIAAGETTRFLQPSANSVVFNLIGGANPSQIFGNLNANGTVILANANGFYFGPNSMIKVGGSFIATTAPTAPDFGSGAGWQFSGMPPLASIVNYGRIEVGAGKSLFLIAENIENHGDLTAPGGNVDLAAGQSVLVSESPDGRGLSAVVKMPAGSVDNFGRVTADGGSIAVQAQVVNQDGLLQANSIAEKNGVIELVASDSLNLGANSEILARGGDAASGSAGGNITLKSDNNFTDASGSQISVAGGVHGGNAGAVEISAENLGDIHSQLDGSAQTGFSGGKVLIDPTDLSLNSSSLDPYAGFANILFQATGNITLAQGTAWDLSGKTGGNSGQLTLEAGGNITFNTGAKITDANGWNVTLDAGWNFGNSSLKSGVGNIVINGGTGTQNGGISLASGDTTLNAGNSILLNNNGYVRTTGGGSILALALGGDISTGSFVSGTQNSGYDFSFNIGGNNPAYANGYKVNDNLGGISTKAGGDVTLIAGGSINPASGAKAMAVSGAFGAAAGDVTLVAGSLVQGNFNVANGTGTILAGVSLVGGQPQLNNSAADAGSSTTPLRLGLIDGSWNVWAANNIYVSEVYNPNGTFNDKKVSVPAGQFSGNADDTDVPATSSFLFNYARDAAVNLWAGNGIELVGANLPRVNGQNTSMPPIYAPRLSLNAGAGGVTIDNSIILYPSAQGALSIVTRDGGSLNGMAQGTSLSGITMSDSSLPGWTTFAQGYAVSPLHLNDANPVTLDIAGGINTFSLTVPTFADINVAGSTYNFGFIGRNLSAAQTTSIAVGGDITYRGDLTSVTLSDPLPATLFSDSADTAVTSKLRFDAATGKLTFVGVMSATDLAFLLNPSVLVLDTTGNPVLDASGNPQTTPLTLTATQQAAINQLSTDSQSATLGDQGLALAGPGKFNVSANNIDLGISGGITVLPPDAALSAVSTAGAALNISTVGNLEMTATKIANEGLFGSVNLTIGGTLDVGGEFTTFGDPAAPKGIFSTGGGDVNVFANSDVNVNGSRIAAYDGGNVTVESLNGNVNAGSGGNGYVSMSAVELDASGHLVTIPASIPGSGILATTVPGSSAKLGNILVETPNGNIAASQGGVIQISFNGSDSSKATAELLAGYELRDSAGNRVTAANLADGTEAHVSEGRNVDASGSGVIAQNIITKATGEVKGLFIGRGDVNIAATTIGSGLIFTPGKVTLSSDQPGNGPTLQVISEQAHTDNGVTASTELPASNVAKNEAQTADDATSVTKKAGGSSEDDLTGKSKTKGKKGITLAQKVSRVTVILPQK